MASTTLFDGGWLGKNTTILHYFWDKIITGSEKMAMKARIRVGSFHWVTVEQIKYPEASYLLGVGENHLQP
jgi:hypothetical protein